MYSKNIKILLLAVASAFCAKTAEAVELPEIIGDDMVLQQNSDAKLWGWSKPNGKVDITTSWNGRHYNVKANGKGEWIAKVATPAASFDTYSITFNDGDATTVNGVMIGEVWFCSGQSNMEMPLNGFWAQPVENSNREIAFSGQYKNRIRMATVPKVASLTPAEKVGGKWKVCVPENSQWFSAVAYHFAATMTKMLDVPVGIINCSWGGSRVEGWLPQSQLAKYSDVDVKKEVNDKNILEYSKPLIMYNGMLHPLIGYTVKGFLWNQGESNINHHDVYAQRLARMVEIWREEWGMGNLPFYMVEIPPYSYGDVNGINGALLREAQNKSVELIPNSGIVCTSDLSKSYEAEDIHASSKQPIGERLAFMAAVKTYGMSGIACDSPTFKNMEVEGDTAILHFNNAPDGFTPNLVLEGFEVAGDDKVFYPAKATEIWDKQEIKVSCDKVTKIASVRYCFKNWSRGKVYSLRWLPIVPFRTDDWK